MSIRFGACKMRRLNQALKYKFWYLYNLFFFSSFVICLSTKLVKPKKRKAGNDLSERLQEAELDAFKAIGESLKHKEQTTLKDEDVLFGELLVAQIKQLKPEVKLMVKMEIHSLLYKHLLAHSTETQPSYYMLNTVGSSARNEYPPPTAASSANTEVSQGLDYGVPNYPVGYFFNKYKQA